MYQNKSTFIQYIFYAFVFFMMLALFYHFTIQNNKRIREQNLIYAEDAARQAAMRIDDTLANSLDLIKQYTQFLSFSLKEASVSSEVIKEVENNSPFNTVRFSDLEGVNYSSSGAVNNIADREFFKEALQGKSGVFVFFDSQTFAQTVLGFYAPVYFRGKVFGVLQGSYLADSYLRDMLRTTYFGKSAQVFLCSPTGEIIANSSSINFSGNILLHLTKQGIIEASQAEEFEKIFKATDGKLLVNTMSSDSSVASDNICIVSLPSFDYRLVQAFPHGVSEVMIRNANMAGIQLELSLLILSACLAAYLLIRSRLQKRALLRDNQLFSTVVKGMSSVFEPRYTIADLENHEYIRLMPRIEGAGMDEIEKGTSEELAEKQAEHIKSKDRKQEFLKFFHTEALRSTLTDSEFTIFECHLGYNGQERWENVIAACIERRDSLPVKVLLLRQDITDIKKRELQTRKRLAIMNRKERQYRLALTSNSLCNYEFNVSKDLIEEDVTEIQNGKALSMLRPKGFVAPCKISACFASWQKDLSPESKAEYEKKTSLDYLLDCFEKGQKEVDLDYWRVEANGEERCIRQAFYLTRDTFSGDIMAMTVLKDISPQVISQRQQTRTLQEALMQARHASAAKSTFLSNMSHDIRTPMNAIIGFATIASSHLDNKEQVEDCLKKVLSSSNHLLCLINDILDMSRIESGKMQLKLQECNISGLMHSLMNIIQSQVKAKQLQLFIETFDINNENVLADPLKLNQVFINLLGNAVKYTPAGGQIYFGIRQKESSQEGCADYIFTVKDNGIGMSKEFVKHIFEPFERESTTTQSGIQGTGLGMSITKNIIEMMNGSIEVESSPGLGTTFTVCLTLKLQELKDEQKLLLPLANYRSLVIDDDCQVCDSVTKMLQKLGLRAEWTTSGKEAIFRTQQALDQNDPFNIYFIDWQMPEMNGIESARKIRKLAGEEAAIIILTAYDWTDIEAEAKEAGVNTFYAKPLFLSDLKNLLLETYKLGEEKEEPVKEYDNFKGKRILLVDDLEMNREVAEFILTESGFNVECAPDGTDAVAMVRNSPEKYYDAILMDVQMPTMNGYEATRSIRNLPRLDVEHMPIIAMTANALEDDREAALKSGMNAHISKPIDIDKFFEALHKYLHREK